ncbi:MAG: D-alanyl-D-alanine carboxypeptidase [Gammaproteobacteria bacterium]|nr:D-alanyl-D-alanine carboxypeptidase [Gammaproteobacteria bacterium]
MKLKVLTRLSTGLLAAVLVSVGHAADPTPIPAPPALKARAYLLMDHQSGRVLASQNENERLDPASITKLMTAYAVFRSIEDKRIGLEDPVLISEQAWRTGGSRSFVDLGDRVPLSVLLKGMIIQSGNDASVALAEHVSGSESAFADLMNVYARELGMTDTNYRNATGLPDPEHYTTASDILKIANAIIREFPDYYRWYSQKDFTWNSITQSNRNGLLWRDTTVDGMKTGFTETAGYCLVSSALRDGMRLVSVVLGTDSPSARESESQTLLNYGYRFYETKLLLPAGKALSEARVWKGDQDLAGIGVNHDIWVTVPRGSGDGLKPVFTLPAQLIAPLDPSVELGKVRISLADETIAEAGLYPITAVAEGSLWQQTRDSVLLWFE